MRGRTRHFRRDRFGSGGAGLMRRGLAHFCHLRAKLFELGSLALFSLRMHARKLAFELLDLIGGFPRLRLVGLSRLRRDELEAIELRLELGLYGRAFACGGRFCGTHAFRFGPGGIELRRQRLLDLGADARELCGKRFLRLLRFKAYPLGLGAGNLSFRSNALGFLGAQSRLFCTQALGLFRAQTGFLETQAFRLFRLEPHLVQGLGDGDLRLRAHARQLGIQLLARRTLCRFSGFGYSRFAQDFGGARFGNGSLAHRFGLGLYARQIGSHRFARLPLGDLACFGDR